MAIAVAMPTAAQAQPTAPSPAAHVVAVTGTSTPYGGGSAHHDRDAGPIGHDHSATAPAIRVLIADGRQIVRTGMRNLLGNAADITVVAEATTGTQTITRGREMRPHVALVAERLSGEDGLGLVRQLHFILPELAVMVTAVQPHDSLVEVLRAGARGYLDADTDADDLARAVRPWPPAVRTCHPPRPVG